MMISLFDPRLWLGIVIWSVLAAGVSYQTGARVEAKAAELRETKATAAALAEQAEENRIVLEQERAAYQSLQDRYNAYNQEKAREKIEVDALIADLRAANRRLSIPVRRAACPVRAGQDPAAAGGTGEEGRADLTPAAAEFLITIAAQGDTAIRKHAAVVDLYEQARKACARQLPIPSTTQE